MMRKRLKEILIALFGQKHSHYFFLHPKRLIVNKFKLIRQNLGNLLAIEEIKNPVLGKNKIISFSLFGTGERYFGKLKEVIGTYHKIFPDWKCRVYIAKDVKKEVVETLLEANCEVYVMQRSGLDLRYMVWRFLAINDKSATAVIFRDLDSIATKREKVMIEQWLLSDKCYHIIRDHPHHDAKIMGGMWGAKRNDLDLKKELRRQLLANHYGIDQLFLEKRIYPVIRNNAMVHDCLSRFPEENPIVIPYDKDESFIGQWI